MSVLGKIDGGGRGGSGPRASGSLQTGPADDGAVGSATAEASARGAKLRPLLLLLPYVARYRGRALAALVALVVAALTTLVVPVAVRRMIDFGFSADGIALINNYFGMMIAVVAVLAIASAPTVYADESGNPAAPSTIESDVHVFVVAEDGTVAEDDDTTVRANTAAGIEDIAQRYISFDQNASHVDVLEAYAIDRNGVRRPVSPGRVREMQEARPCGVPTFKDAWLRDVIFPDVGTGP